MASKKISNRAIRTVGIFIDGQNLYYARKELEIHIDYKKFTEQIKVQLKKRDSNNLQLGFVRYYDLDMSSEYASPDYKFFISKLEELNIRIIRKDFKIIRNGDCSYRKLNFDVEIAVDAIDFINFYDIFVLVSGDSDFNYLVTRLKGVQKSVCVVSTQNLISKELINNSNVIIWLEEIANKIKLDY